MAIQVLDQNTIDRIAAGEVVERPSSVVKELVENAIDAGATAITVEIKDGGISFIRITDNGCGIDGKEIPLAFLRHSTSKIKSVEDLMSVSSLGFRGEALSSIAAVSQVEMITKTLSCFTGFRYLIEGGREVSIEEVGAPEGTTFIIRNLFYNTPVRRKFLKTSATEAGYVSSLIEHISLSHPDISFRFINNNQNKLHTSGNMNLKDIIYNVYGRDITKNLISLKASTQDIEIDGFIGKPAICRGNRTYENYYINGRYIKSSIITKAIEEAYKGFIMNHNYPFTAMHFKINPGILDVNVHPTKMELRFSKNDFVYNFVLNAVRNALKQPELIPEVRIDLKTSQPSQPVNQTADSVKEDIITYQKAPSPAYQSMQNHSTDSKASYRAPLVNPPAAANITDNVKDAVLHANEKAKAAATQTFETSAPQKQEKIGTKWYADKDYSSKSRLPEPFEINRSKQMILEETQKSASVEKTSIDTARQISMFEDKLLDQTHDATYRIIGQLFDTYWLVEFDDRFYMMDQHAAHEKILFERFMKRLLENRQDTQMIMPPVVLSLNMREEQVLKENLSVFTRVGYEIEEFGGSEYKVTGIPAGLPDIDCKLLLTDLLDSLVEDGSKNLEAVTEKVASMSCKAAVKGNNHLSFQEAEKLMKELMSAENPYNCPHGRPTLIMMTRYEIEKKFKRIV